MVYIERYLEANQKVGTYCHYDSTSCQHGILVDV